MRLEELYALIKERRLDRQLKYLYAIDKYGELDCHYDRMAALLEEFKAFAPEAEEGELFSAPGRAELGGNHTDHQKGCVLAAAVDMDALAVAAPNGSDVVRIKSEGYAPFEVDLSFLLPVTEEKNSPSALVRGIAAALKADGFTIGGFTACVHSNVPGGSGLSSSACIEVLIGTIFSELFNGGNISPLAIAKAGQYAENNYAMKPSGLLDQAAAAFGGLTAMDFSREQDPVTDVIDYDFAKKGYTFCVINPGCSHADLTDDYAAITVEMRAVAELFGKRLLCEVDEGEFMTALPDIRKKLSVRAVLRALHYFAENRRAQDEAKRLREDNIEGYLRLVNESGRSSELCLQNAFSPAHPEQQELTLALELTRRLLGGAGAYRLQGGGFAGTVQAYVPTAEYDRFAAEIDRVFGAGACRRIAIRPVGGVKLTEVRYLG